jgi:hypothetical protein
MCGIVALFRTPATNVPDGTLEAMTTAVAHRGPDGWGTEFLSLEQDAPWGVALGHRRLSILDLSPAGRQPMVYRDRLWMTYNGEVYNYVELRRELEALGVETQEAIDYLNLASQPQVAARGAAFRVRFDNLPELEKHLENEGLAIHIVSMEDAEKMTDLQIGIKVQKRFPLESRFRLTENNPPRPMDITG